MPMTEKQPNHLLGELSPYLLQHAYNPVDWYPWREDVLTKARTENRLMVISIGYAACHWCHVMEHESFEDAEVAALMNGNFVSVKVDREERPDIDQVYMLSAYAATGRGGWPLNVIALPDQRPVFAGTYYSKQDWIHILNYFADMHSTHPAELIRQAEEIERSMKRGRGSRPVFDMNPVASSTLNDIFSTWKDDLDFVKGGTHGGPKFPMPANLDCLLRYGARCGKEQVMEYVKLTLDRMAMGGICDQLGGGFSRYSVDDSWQVPHFEKMLYDNAQLISLYSNAFAATQISSYKKVVQETIAFVIRELTAPGGLFLASLDADSEGREGTFYAWTNEEIRNCLGAGSAIFLEYFCCEETGNWENKMNVLRRSVSDEVFARDHALSDEQFAVMMQSYREQLLALRGNRIRPATDDKILTCWNALMISALVHAARVFDKPVWLDQAITTATFYKEQAYQRNGKLWRNAKGGSLTIDGFLDDYALLIRSFLDLYQATFGQEWLQAVEMLLAEVVTHFSDGDGLFFNLSSGEGQRLIMETVELSDNVIPASNSVMAANLWTAGYLTGHVEYISRSEKMLKSMMPEIGRNPGFHANWATLLQEFISGPVEVNIIGEEYLVLLKEFSSYYMPEVIFSGGERKSPAETSETRFTAGKTLIYVCRGKSCFPPVDTVAEAVRLILEP